MIEKYINRKLESCEVVHHKNGNKLDNRIDNLEVINRRSHSKMHGTIFKWSKSYEYCVDCGTQSRKHEGKGLCLRCYQRHRPKKKS